MRCLPPKTITCPLFMFRFRFCSNMTWGRHFGPTPETILAVSQGIYRVLGLGVQGLGFGGFRKIYVRSLNKCENGYKT